MPYSYNYFKSTIKEHIINTVHTSSKILDVGAGAGTYAKLLMSANYILDAVEIYEPYVKKYNLTKLYRKIDIANICNYDYSEYDYIILGDVLEHISAKPAQKLISEICAAHKMCLVAVPYMYPQASEDENKYQMHLQPDLTHEIMLQRYPHLKLLIKNSAYGYYINY